MGRIEDIEARLRVVDQKLADLETGLRQDVTTLKAIIAALQEQATDPATLASLENLATSIEGRVMNLTVLDAETPPPETPV